MSVCAVERARSRKIEDVEIDTEPLLIRPMPDYASTILSASVREIPKTPAFRPQLSPPRPYHMWDLLKIEQKMEEIVRHEGKNCDSDTKASLDRLLSLDKQRIEALQKSALEAASKGSWSVWQTVAQYVATASSIILGLTVLGAAPIAGGLLIAAGGLGLLNRAISDSGGWQWLTSRLYASRDLQMKIAERIDSGFTYLTMAMALSGAIGAYQAGAWALSAASRSDNLNRALQFLLLASGAMQQLTRIGMAHADRKIMHLHSDLKKLETQSVSARQHILLDTLRFRSLIELSEEIDSRIRSAISSCPI